MFIFQLVLVLFFIKVAGHISIRLGQPSVIGKIIVGIILGPSLLGWVHESDLITTFSNIGVILLMFLAGLETDVKTLNETKKGATFVAVGGVIFPILFSFIAALSFGLSNEQALFIGLVLAATSVSISVQTLQEINRLKTKEGSTLLGAAVLDDIIVVILLAVAMSFLTGESVSYTNLIGGKIIFFIGLFLVGKYLVPPFMRYFSKLLTSESIVSGALVICFTLAFVGEHYFGIAMIIGAFFAGVSLGQTPFRETIEEKTLPIANGIFVPFFFISIGLSVSFKGIGDNLWFLLAFTILAILTKLIGSGLGAKLSGFSWSSSIAIGSGMISRGEVALILASMGIANNLLPETYYTALILVVIITTIVTPPLLNLSFKRIKE